MKIDEMIENDGWHCVATHPAPAVATLESRRQARASHRLAQVCGAQQHNEYVCRKRFACRRQPYHDRHIDAAWTCGNAARRKNVGATTATTTE
jgi:hypothetical protein